MDPLKKKLVAGARALGAPLDESQAAALLAYLDVLERWNARFNLTAIRDRDAMVAAHLLDSLAIARKIEGPRVADVGSGAGLPGIPLAICLPTIEFTLLDANGKKTRFLQEARRALGLENVTVRHTRVEDYRPASGFDTVVCRAFAPLPRLLHLAGHLLGTGGVIVAQKGRFFDNEVAELPVGWQAEVSRLTVPGLLRERHAVTLRRSESMSV